jgi:hypothetical protein
MPWSKKLIDTVEWLRKYDMYEAADEIERLRKFCLTSLSLSMIMGTASASSKFAQLLAPR